MKVASMLALIVVSASLYASTSFAENVRFGDISFERKTISMGGDTLTYYTSSDDSDKPVLMLIQGSGCQPPVVLSPGGNYSTIYGMIDAAKDGRFDVVVAEKPHGAATPIREAGTAKNCPLEFNSTFSLSSWSVAIQRILDSEVGPYPDRKVFLLGASEGAVVAAHIAAQMPNEIDKIALAGLSGAGQLFDLVDKAYTEGADDQHRLGALRELTDALDKVRQDPQSATKFFAGHPYKRWSSFLSVDTLDDLRKSDAGVYLISGMQDQSVPILSTEFAWVQLFWSGRDVEFRRIPGADHGLLDKEKPEMGSVALEYKRVFDWLAE